MQFENYSKNVKNSKWFLDKRETRLKRVNKYMTARTTFDFAKFVDILYKNLRKWPQEEEEEELFDLKDRDSKASRG